MAFIKLQIVDPQHNAAFVGSGPANFNGSALVPLELQHVPLYFRWYASSVSRINEQDEVLGYSMNEPALPTPEYISPAVLGLGSHVITFAVSDRAGEKEPDFSAIKHAGITGGQPAGRVGEQPCVIHVFTAKIISPANGQLVTRDTLALKAKAPPLWLDDEYQAINRLAYRWLLEPVGNPAGRPKADSAKLGREVKNVFDKNELSLTYTFAPLDTQFVGQYLITLLVTDSSNEEIGEDSASVAVVF